MGTMNALITRTNRLLYPADDTPTQSALAGAVDAATTVWLYDGSLLSPDEEELLTVGVFVECDRELAAIVAANHETNTLTVRRGAGGTTPATHAVGAVLRLAPAFPAQDVFDALADNIVALYPSLYRRATQTVTLTAGHTVVDANALTAEGLTYLRGSRYYQADVTLVPTATGQAILTSAPAGATAYFTYRGKFTRPTSSAENLQTVAGIEESWERIAMIGAAAQLLSSREFDSVNQEFVTEQMRSEGFPAGTSSRLRAQLLQYHQFLLEQARRAQLAANSEVVSHNTVAAVGGY